MAEELKKIVDLEVRGVSTVKELRKQISDLRDALVRLDKDSEDYKKTVDELIEDEKLLNDVMKAGKNEVSAATGSYNALNNEMKALQKVWKEVTSEAERARIGTRIRELNEQLKEMDATIGNNQRKVGSYEEALRKVFDTPQQELRKLRQELAQLTVGTDEYNRVFARMSELTIQITKQQQMLKYASTDLGTMLGNVAGIAQGVVGGLSAINAAMGLMGNEDSDVQKAMLKVQRFMALVQGLAALEGLSDKLKGFSMALNKLFGGIFAGSKQIENLEKTLKAAEGTTEQVTKEMSANATEISRNAVATRELAEATKELSTYENDRVTKLQFGIQEDKEQLAILIERRNAIEAEINSLGRFDQLKAHQLVQLNNEITATETRIKTAEAEINKIKGLDNSTRSLTASEEKLSKTEEGLGKDVKKTNDQLNAQSAAGNAAGAGGKAAGAGATAAAAGTGLWSKALLVLGTVLKTIGIGLLIAGLVALLGLLGKGLKPIWEWINGTKAAKDATDALKKSTDELNATLAERDEEMDFQSRLMDAQGKGYKEIYEYEKSVTQESLRLAKAELAEAEATAAQIGAKKLAKDKYEDFRETLESLRETTANYEKQLKSLDQQYIIDQEREKHRRGGGGGGDSTLNEAKKLYQTLADLYKTDRDKLRETYEKNKEILMKGIKDREMRNKALLLLQKKYYNDLAELAKEKRAELLGIYEGQEKRRLALLNVYSEDYLAEAKNVLEEELKINLAGAAKRVGFIQKTDAEIAAMDAQTKKEYLERQKLYNNERYLLEAEYNKNYDALVAEREKRVMAEERATLQINEAMAKSEAELLDAKIALAEYDLAHLFQEEGEGAEAFRLRVVEAVRALEDLKKAKKDVEATDWTQLKLDNDAEQARQENGDYSMQYYKARLNAAQHYYDNLKQLENENLEQFRARQLDAMAEVRDIEKAILDQRIQNWSNLANSIGDIMGSIADLYQTEIDAQKDADGKYNAESKRKFEWVKRLQIAQATINTISGAIAAYMGCQELGQPWGMVLGIAQAAAVTAAGMAEIAKIKNTKLDNNGSNTETRYATAVPVLSDYVPQGTTNITGGQEIEQLRNALGEMNLSVSVSEINEVQHRVAVRESEATF